MTKKYYGLRRRPTFEEMLKEAMTHRLKIEIIPERQVIDLSTNNIDFDDFDLSKYDRRLRLNLGFKLMNKFFNTNCSLICLMK